MTRYAAYTPGASQPVMASWYDTGFATYPDLPPLDRLIVMTDDQWANRQNTPFIDGNGNFVARPAPVYSNQQIAATELATRVALGIAITCTANAALNATYALDAVTLEQIASVARDSASGLGLPGGLTTFTYPDATSTPRMFNAAQLIALYKAMRDLMLALNTQTAVMANGGTPVWPAQSATIA